MTLIVGLRGIGKSYLAADSRVTNVVTGNSKDDVSKWTGFGKQDACVVAGNALMAAFVCEELRQLAGPDPTYEKVKQVFDTKLKSVAKRFNTTTGNYASCVIMLAGYRSSEKDTFDAAKIGEVMAAGVKRRDEGITVHQSIDKEIIKGMSYTMTMAEILGKQVGKGTRVTVGLPRSELTAYEVKIQGDGIEVVTTEADTFEALIYGADTAVRRLELPIDRISDIFFRDVSNQKGETIIQIDGIHFIAFINGTIKERGYNNVGGNVIPILVTPTSVMISSGTVGRIDLRTGKPEVLNEVKVISGKMHFKDKVGDFKPYRTLQDIKESSGLSLDHQI
ncbi:MAG TPA: hypothetical protein VK694_05860 [Verrucomicrobiae bacterium]|nr:hypothetical protein [Verrucomicrobiae bacterium]